MATTKPQAAPTPQAIPTDAILADEPVVTNATVYKNMGIPYCDRCGEKYRSDLSGELMCPIDIPDCPRKS